MRKHILRTCVACKTIRKKKDLIRLVMDKNNQVVIDSTGKAAGRGTYVCNKDCLKKAIEENAFPRAFRKKAEPSEALRLNSFGASATLAKEGKN